MSDARDFLGADALSAYLDGECSEAERNEVEARLAESAEWRAELEEVRGVRAMLRSVAARDAPAGFWDDVLAHVAAAEITDPTDQAHEDASADVVSLGERRRKPGRWIATAFAAAAAVGLAVIIVPQRHTVRPDVAAVVAQHGAQTSDHFGPIGTITPAGPLGGFRR